MDPSPNELQNSVFEAAEALIAAGARPTVQRIHQIVGGPVRRIRPLFDAWWRSLAARLDEGQSSTNTRLTSDEAAEAFVRRAIDQARAASRKRVSLRGTRASPNLKIHLRETTPAALKSAYKRAEKELEELRSKEHALEDKLIRIRNIVAVTEARAALIASALRQGADVPSGRKNGA